MIVDAGWHRGVALLWRRIMSFKTSALLQGHPVCQVSSSDRIQW